MKSELISIIVIVYNTEQYITRCINSIINQTYDNLEIIVINDGSTDKSSSKLKRLSSKDKRIKVIERENKGRYLSRLEGYKNTTGKYVLYLDGDDWLDKNAVSIMYNALKEEKADVVRCQSKEYEENEVIVPKSVINRNVLMDVKNLEPQFFDLLYKTNYCNTVCKQLMKRSVMSHITKIEEELNYFEDLACNIEIYKKMKSVLFIPDELYIYNLDHSYKKKKSSKREVLKKIQNAIYTYYQLFDSVKQFEIKNKKEYSKFAAMRFMEQITNLTIELVKTHISKRNFDIIMNNILTDKRVEEIYKVLEKEDITIICNDMKDIDKKIIKNCEFLLNKKTNTFYNHNKYRFLKFFKN